MSGDLNMPFEPVGGDPIPVTEHLHFAGGVVVGALRLDLEGGTHPAVMFRFANADGSGFYPPIVLTCDRVADLERLPDLFRDAVTCAVSEAKP